MHISDWSSDVCSSDLVGYRYKGQFLDVLPYGAHAAAEAEPVLEEMAGWTESTVGITEYDKLPVHARRYLERIAEVCDVGVDMVSTGPARMAPIALPPPHADKRRVGRECVSTCRSRGATHHKKKKK